MSSFKSHEQVKYDRNKLSKMACNIVKNVHDYFVRENENQSFLQDPYKVYLRTALAAQITRTSVARIIKERDTESSGGRILFKTPGRHKIRDRAKKEIDCFAMETVRQRIYECYLQAQIPCILRFVKEFKQKNIIKNSSHTNLRRILYSNGFRYKRYSGRRILLERGDVVIKRCQFFKKIHSVNCENILWIGETCFSSPFKKNSYGKIVKLIILHAGTSNGFISNALCIKTSKNMFVPFQKEISTEYFQKYFEKIIELTPQGTHIILNEAPCHNADSNKPPNLYSDKKTIIEWLDRNNIPYDQDFHKAELLDLVRMAKPIIPSYTLEQIALNKGYNLIRVPPHHNHFNAIEFIWIKLKEIVSKKICESNAIIDSQILENIVRTSIDKITPDNWAEAVKAAENTIKNARNLECHLETAVESVFKEIDLIKKSGREDLEAIKYYDDISELSDYQTDSSGEDNQMDLDNTEFKDYNLSSNQPYCSDDNIYEEKCSLILPVVTEVCSSTPESIISSSCIDNLISDRLSDVKVRRIRLDACEVVPSTSSSLL